MLAREHTLYLIWDFPAWRGAADGLYYLLPQLPGINSNLLQLIAGGAADVKPLVQSFVSSGLIFFATGLMLRRKDL